MELETKSRGNPAPSGALPGNRALSAHLGAALLCLLAVACGDDDAGPRPMDGGGLDGQTSDGARPDAPATDAPMPADARTDAQDGASDEPSVRVSPTSGLTTRETGVSAMFEVVLGSAPSADVVIALSSSDATEGSVAPASLTFTAANWNAPQTVTVTGVDDEERDGPVVYTVVTAPADSADAAYDGVDGDDVSVTNLDDESAGIVVDPVGGLTTSESGTTATFTVALLTAPAAEVAIAISSGDESEGTVSADSLVFTTENWAAPQTVIVTGADDEELDGTVDYVVMVGPVSGTDAEYAALDPADVSLQNLDDESPGFRVAPTSLDVTEGGASATFTVVLGSPPANDVSIELASSDDEEVVIDTTSMTFTPDNWNAPQTVTVRGLDDDVADGTQVVTITLGTATSDDATYAGLDPDDVSVRNLDDETPGVNVTPTAVEVNEAGETATFEAVLSSRPTADVSFTLASADDTEASVAPTMLTFTAENWNAPQTVTVTGLDDDIADGHQMFLVTTSVAASADPGYDGLAVPDVTVTNRDDETPGITVTPTMGLSTTEAGGAATFTVRLTSEPTADVRIPVASSDSTEGTADPMLLTFTSTNWSAPQTVTVTGVDDDVADGAQRYRVVLGAATSGDATYAGMDPTDVEVTNGDDETPGFVLEAATNLRTSESGATAEFTLRLASEPTGNVSVRAVSSDATEGTVSPATHTFTPANWDAPVTFTVTGVNDTFTDGDQRYSVNLTLDSSADPAYALLDPPDVQLTNTDNETPGFTVAPTTVTVSETGTTATFTIVLNAEPTADVVVPVRSGLPAEASISVSSLRFTSANWNAPQTVTVTGRDDSVRDGTQSFRIVTGPATSTDALYNGLDLADVVVSVLDDETGGVLVQPTAGLVTGEDGTSAAFTVRLGSQPTANVTVPLRVSDTREGRISVSSLVFTPTDWNVTQTVTVTGLDDAIADGDRRYTVFLDAATSADSNYHLLNATDVLLTNLDNDSAGIRVVPTSTLTTSEAGGTDSFTVVLNSQPTADVVIPLESSAPDEATVSPVSLTFTSTNWNVAQTVTVTGVDDAIADGDQLFTIRLLPAMTTDTAYSNRDGADVTGTNSDNETAGIVVRPTRGLRTTEAGGTDTFTIELLSQPTANVTIALSSSNSREGTVSPASAVFTPANWNTPITVTVTGADDGRTDGNQVYLIVTAPAVSTDPSYSGRNAQDITVTNVDDESAGITVTPAAVPLRTTEAGGTATFTIVLVSQPVANVVIDLVSTNDEEGTVSTPSVTFTPANWNMPVTVTVTGVDDGVTDGDQSFGVLTLPATSTDAAYDGLNAADVSVVNEDDET